MGQLPHTRSPQFQLVDNVVVSATFDPSRSGVKSWTLSRPQPFPDDMLNHEQGHYNISALLARDFFVELMLMKATVFATEALGRAAINAVAARTTGRLAAVQRLYDNEVHPEQNRGLSRGPIQQGWDAILQQAFNTARASGTTSANGVPHKILLLDAMASAGKRP